MDIRPITLKELVQWNGLVFLLALVGLVGVVLVFFVVTLPHPQDPYIDLTGYMHSSADETRRLVNDCVHNEHVISLALSTSRVPATVALGIMSAVSLLTGLSTLFAYLIYRRLETPGGSQNVL